MHLGMPLCHFLVKNGFITDKKKEIDMILNANVQCKCSRIKGLKIKRPQTFFVSKSNEKFSARTGT